MSDPHEPSPPEPSELDAALAAEIAAALGDQSIDDLIDPPATGDHRSMEGMIVQIRGEEVYVEFGPKTQGVCPISHFDEKPEPGTRCSFKVVRRDSDDGMLILSHKGGVQKAQW